MSRYKKAITGEIEIPIDGVNFLIYPTLEDKKDLLDLVQKTQVVEEVDEKGEDGNVVKTKRMKGTQFKISDLADACAKLVYEGCYNHGERGNRLGKKEEEKDTTYDDVLATVLSVDLMELYLKVLRELNIINEKVEKKIKKSIKDKIEGKDIKKK